MFLLVAILFIGTQAFAQTTISGTVTDSNGEAVPGASVRVKGYSDLGTITDLNGQYSINAPAEATTLIFSFVGMKTVEVEIAGQTRVNATLDNEDVSVDEVVVVAYGVQRREAATGAVGVVNADDIETTTVTSPERLLQSRVAGVQMNSFSGQPGAETTMNIRGFTSFSTDNQPLYVIDGVPVESTNQSYFTSTGNILNSFNPGDIASISVLKDAAAASVYGSRAANGVILITTKAGKAGKSNFNFKVKYGLSKVANDNDFRQLTPGELYSYNRQTIINSGGDPTDANTYGGFYAATTLPADVPVYDWADPDNMFEKANSKEYEFNASGGTEKFTHYTSLGYMQNKSIMVETALERFSVRNNTDVKLNDYFKVGTKISGAFVNSKDRPNESLYYANPFWASVNILPWELPYNEDGSFNFDIPSNSGTNYLASAAFDDQWSKEYKFNGSFYAEVNPFEGLTIKSLNSIELFFANGRRYWDPRGAVEGDELGTVQIVNQNVRVLNTSNTINYMKTFADVHNVRVLAGQEAFHRINRQDYASGGETGSKIPHLNSANPTTLSSSLAWFEYSISSYFGILDYNYNDRYFVSASLRTDGNSKFGKDNRWATFWSASASWNIHNEAFLGGLTFIDMLKLRFSYGINGNHNIGTYSQYGTYSPMTYGLVSGQQPSGLANPTLTWELNGSYNLGVDFAVFGKLQGTVDVYHRTTSELLFDVPLSRTTGFATLQQNVGGMINKGLEVSLQYNFRLSDFDFTIRGNIAGNQSEVTELEGEQEEFSQGFWRKTVVGGSYQQYNVFDWAGVNPTNGMGLWYDDNGDITSNYNNARRVVTGKVEPDYQGGIGADISWKGLSLSMFFDFKVGHYIYIMESHYTEADGFSWGNNQSAAVLDYWKEPGDITGTPKPLVNNGSNSSAWGTSRYLERGDFLRIKDLSLSYTLPKEIVSKAKMNNVRVYVVGNNVFTWHDVSYWDPERETTGGGYIKFPNVKTIQFGLEIGF